MGRWGRLEFFFWGGEFAIFWCIRFVGWGGVVLADFRLLGGECKDFQ